MTEPLTWPECIALGERHPTREKPEHSAGQAIATENVPQTRPRGIRTRRRDGWGIPATVFVATVIGGIPLLVLMNAIVKGLVFARAGLQP